MPTRPEGAIKSKASLLQEVLDSSGRYDAAKFARYLDWDQSDIAKFLGRDRSAVSARPTAPSFQDHLAQLAAVIREALEFVGNDSLLRAWLRTPLRALDDRSPKQLILSNQVGLVSALLRETEAALIM
jgi:hypothetical protein